ncbi:hypothetical protein PALA52_01105 [Pseudomonas aeruginosa]|nr:hypothetical protein PALA52_01105 [Pseudomonas aeruginosa]
MKTDPLGYPSFIHAARARNAQARQRQAQALRLRLVRPPRGCQVQGGGKITVIVASLVLLYAIEGFPAMGTPTLSTA